MVSSAGNGDERATGGLIWIDEDIGAEKRRDTHSIETSEEA